MVAYACPGQFPAEVEKLVVMDAFLPGVPGWELAYNSPDLALSLSRSDARSAGARPGENLFCIGMSQSQVNTMTRIGSYVSVILMLVFMYEYWTGQQW